MWGELSTQTEPTPAVIDILPLSSPGSLHSMAYLKAARWHFVAADTLCAAHSTLLPSHTSVRNFLSDLNRAGVWYLLLLFWLKLATRTWSEMFLFSLFLFGWCSSDVSSVWQLLHQMSKTNRRIALLSPALSVCSVGLLEWRSERSNLFNIWMKILWRLGLEFPLPWRCFARPSLQPPSGAACLWMYVWNGGDLRN